MDRVLVADSSPAHPGPARVNSRQRPLVKDEGGMATPAAEGIELEDSGPQVGSGTQEAEAPLALGRC